jgi:[glutamine synthetase] adenylyltransferase / [glutamine synthetase]-adenylyl-L-tyrosine phosphorylase
MPESLAPPLVEAVRTALLRQGVPSGPREVEEFLASLGPVYRAEEPPEGVALHLRLAKDLTLARPARVWATQCGDGRYEVTVVAFDYFAELSILCGLLAAQGLDIEAGRVHTSARAAGAASTPSARPRGRSPVPPASRKIVDVFRVAPRAGAAAPDAAELERELLELLSLVAEGRSLDARERLNLRLVEALPSGAGSAAGALDPVDITFDNAVHPEWTVMDVRGADTPGFLYALANALATRRIYVQGVRIESVGGEARDRFWITHADRGRIEDGPDQQALRLAIALIKQFTHILPTAPDPARALRSFDQLIDRLMTDAPAALGTFGNPDGLRQLAQLLGSSAFLWEDFMRLQFEHLLPVLGDWKTRPLLSREEQEAELQRRLRDAMSHEERKRVVNLHKDEQMLLIDMKHLLDPSLTLDGFSRTLTDLAEAVVASALRVCLARLAATSGLPLLRDGRPCPVAVCGLGKLGGREMGYASDLELLCVYDDAGPTEDSGLDPGRFFDELVREMTAFITAREEGIFHIDLRLRPHGGKGPLASPLSALRDYYRAGGGAAPFERQAVLKLRWIAGDEPLGREVERTRDRFVWSGEPWDREASLHLRDRQTRELVPPGRFNVKLSPGALVEVEYAAQYLQIRHGREHAELRTPSTTRALRALRMLGILSSEEHVILIEGYVFWRRVADALRMVRGNAKDLLLPEEDSNDLGFLARRLGYSGSRPEAGRALLRDLSGHASRVGALFAARFRKDRPTGCSRS